MRSAISPIPTAMPICCLNSSVAATSARARSSPPIGRSPNGARSSPTPPASSPSWTASSTTPRSWPSRASPTASRKHRNDPSCVPRSAGEPSHDQTHHKPAAHHRPPDPDLLDGRASLRGLPTGRRTARGDLAVLLYPDPGPVSRSVPAPPRRPHRRPAVLTLKPPLHRKKGPHLRGPLVYSKHSTIFVRIVSAANIGLRNAGRTGRIA